MKDLKQIAAMLDETGYKEEAEVVLMAQSAISGLKKRSDHMKERARKAENREESRDSTFFLAGWNGANGLVDSKKLFISTRKLADKE